jgi:hypothetical protein
MPGRRSKGDDTGIASRIIGDGLGARLAAQRGQRLIEVADYDAPTAVFQEADHRLDLRPHASGREMAFLTGPLPWVMMSWPSSSISCTQRSDRRGRCRRLLIRRTLRAVRVDGVAPDGHQTAAPKAPRRRRVRRA